MPCIAYISPNLTSEEKQSFLDAAQRFQVSIVFGEGFLRDGLLVAQNLKKETAIDCFIAHANTARLIKEHIPDIPCCTYAVTNFDYASAIFNSNIDASHTLGIFRYHGDPFTFNDEEIGRICNRKIRSIVLDHTRKYDYIEVLRKHGCTVAVGRTAHLEKLCQEENVPCIIVRPNPASCNNAILRAMELINARNKEKARSELLQESLNSSSDGVIALDANGNIILFNAAMENFTGISERRIVGISKEDAMISSPLLKKAFEATDEAIIEHAKVQYCVLHHSTVGLTKAKEILRLITVSNIVRAGSKLRHSLSSTGFSAKYTFANILSCSENMDELKKRAVNFAHVSSNILIVGESGTGKELFAQSIHNASPFASGPFVAVNCASIPENLLESELYGYEEGAFTGAKKGGKIGFMELSHGGTLFLDEIGELSLSFQSKLLRSIQERKIMRVGGTELIPIRNRIICATNRDLKKACQENLFREDLFYRIDVLHLTIPPIRERRQDIRILATAFCKQKNEALGKKVVLDEYILKRLETYEWPGNVRQLESFIERLIASVDEPKISEERFEAIFKDLQEPAGNAGTSIDAPLSKDYMLIKRGTLSEIEEQIIEKTLEACNGNASLAASRLGINRSTLWRRHSASK